MIERKRRTSCRQHRAFLCVVAVLAIGLAAPWSPGLGAHEHHHGEVRSELGSAQVAGLHIPDVELTDQDGHRVHIVADVLGRRMALVSFIYTSCTTTCPLVGATVAALAEDLKKDGADLAIVSVSIDPDYDTPARLLAWRQRYGDLPQWTLLTGPKREINQLLRAFGAYSPSLEDHQDILMLGPNPAGRWTRMNALAASDAVAAAIRAAMGSDAK
jgi:protein SCO1/2